ncbi:MAG: phospho-sugar mutase [Bacteroidetes bacterium]|nr:MAG: phospho-sugar mutase [Bacteroidota bacterium]
MDTSLQSKAQTWLNSPIDEEAKADIRRMLDSSDPTELTDAFYKDLEFGTGGLRGIMGIGSNRMNKYTVGMATQGFANYLRSAFPGEEVKVAIAYDSRNNSAYFGDITASVFSANGIKVFLFEELRPTPELSFAIRHLGCQGGVVLTASHNPKEYNGYKAYWNDGGQLIPPHDKRVIEEVSKVKGIGDVKWTKDPANITMIKDEVDEAYLATIAKNALNPGAITRQKDLKIVFSPIHGTGITMVPRILERLGFTNVTILEAQATPDGNFPTVVYPNPEERDAMSLALAKAKEIDADLVMATDPDADRVGIGLKNPQGEWELLNGNQTGSLLVYYLLKQWQATGKLTGKQYVVKTIVTTELIAAIAEHFQVKSYDTLTGFKWIAKLIHELEGKEQFIGGGEESYGYLIGDSVRDKDAVASCAMIAEIVAYAKDQGQSLFDLLTEIYLTFGMYRESLISITRKGKKGAEEIQEMMQQLRETPPSTINNSPLVRVIDYQNLTERDLTTGQVRQLEGFPSSNVLQFFTADGSKISARPSGTEPKIKFYFSVREVLSSAESFAATQQLLDERIAAITRDLKLS